MRSPAGRTDAGIRPRNVQAITEIKRDDLKKRIAHCEYVVDPHEVAAAVIVKLALAEESLWPSAPPCGPNHAAVAARPRHRAA
jgi:hypothetical protein